ncbi:MAG: hypothetical protein NWS99_10460, partial [Paracoccaceae bacterium]|nr:hypothetical protein [Paracoccaceae bacterium]
MQDAIGRNLGMMMTQEAKSGRLTTALLTGVVVIGVAGALVAVLRPALKKDPMPTMTEQAATVPTPVAQSPQAPPTAVAQAPSVPAPAIDPAPTQPSAADPASKPAPNVVVADVGVPNAVVAVPTAPAPTPPPLAPVAPDAPPTARLEKAPAPVGAAPSQP